MAPLSAFCSILVVAAWLWLVLSVVGGTFSVVAGGGAATGGSTADFFDFPAVTPAARRLLLPEEPRPAVLPVTELGDLLPSSTAAPALRPLPAGGAAGGGFRPLPWPLYYAVPTSEPSAAEAASEATLSGSSDLQLPAAEKNSRLRRTFWFIFSYEYERRFAARVSFFSLVFIASVLLMCESYRWSLSALSLVCCREVQGELRMSVRDVLENDFRDYLTLYKDLFIISPKLTCSVLRATLLILRHNFDTVTNINCDYTVEPDDFKPIEWKNSRVLGFFDELSALLKLFAKKQWAAVKYNCWDMFRRSVDTVTRGGRAAESSRGTLVLFKRSQNLMRTQIRQQKRRVVHRWNKRKFFTNPQDFSSQFSLPKDISTSSTEEIVRNVDKGLFLRHVGVREFIDCRAQAKRLRRFRALFLWPVVPVVLTLWTCFIVSLVLAHFNGSRTDGAGAEILCKEFLPEWIALLAATLGSAWIALLGFEEVRMRLVESLLAANVEAIVEFVNISISMLWTISVEEVLAGYIVAVTEEVQEAPPDRLAELMAAKVQELEKATAARNAKMTTPRKPQSRKKGFAVVDDNSQAYEQSMVAASKHSIEYIYLPAEGSGVAPPFTVPMGLPPDVPDDEAAAAAPSSWNRQTRGTVGGIGRPAFGREYENDTLGKIGKHFNQLLNFIPARRNSASSDPSASPKCCRKSSIELSLLDQASKSPPVKKVDDLSALSHIDSTVMFIETYDAELAATAKLQQAVASESDRLAAAAAAASAIPEGEDEDEEETLRRKEWQTWRSSIIEPKRLLDSEGGICAPGDLGNVGDSALVTTERQSLEQFYEALNQKERPAKWGDLTTPGRG